MRQVLPFLRKISVENRLLFLVFFICGTITLFRSPILSFDTFSYLQHEITRFPVYVLFLNLLNLVFGDHYDWIAVLIQLLLGFSAIWALFKKASYLLKLNPLHKTALLLVLLFPYFPPLDVALNVCSEGLAYPFYLLLVFYTIDFLFMDQIKKWVPLTIVYLLLCLTRGQFIVIGPILALLFLLRHKKNIMKIKHLALLILLLVLPLINGFLDRTYRKIFYGYFEPAPYTYVNAITLPLYASKASDVKLLSRQDQKDIFEMSHKRIDSLGLLSSKVQGNYHEKYMLFHNNFPVICNQNIHLNGLRYYRNHGSIPPQNAFAIENLCRELFPILIQEHSKEWLALYLTGIIYGFKSIVILIMVIVLAFWSLWKVIKKYTLKYGFILLGTLLLLSNAMIVGVASHSIMRYLFYNYFIGVLILIILLRKIPATNES